MKSFFLILCSLGIISYTLTATIITVSNNPNIPAQFTSLQTAIDSASAGDTIYVHPSTIIHGDITIDKELHLTGDGHFWYNNQLPRSGLRGIALLSGASNSTFRGLRCYFTTASVNLVNNIIIDRCWMWYPSEICGSYWIITNSGITGGNNTDPAIDVNNNSNIIISNNIFYSSYYKVSSAQNTVLINNNIFHNGNLGSVWNAIISNNIFYFSNPTGCMYSTFNNNITYNTNQNELPYGTNTGGGNLQGVDPQFVDILGSHYPEDYDFHLQSTSPGIGAGTDGTDIGIFGGTFPWPEAENNTIDYSGEPAIPQVRFMNILNTIVGQNGTLRFNARVEVKK